MARYDKRQIVQIIENLLNANQIIKQVNIGHEAEISDMLQVCQEAAILVGTQLESKKELEHIVHMLEAYCESLYEFSMNYADAEVRMANSEKIQNQLLQIKNVVDTDLPEIKKEMVFFPYKASMWDSLESVWKAADADPECDAYVIPIPYYDKNPDGTFREFHYEGDQYPDYVPITRYEEYNLEERQPDVIYIHNPYDAENYVTTVDPEYYSECLRNYTNCLVYIPYFVVDDTRSIDKLEHFALSPAVFYSDLVVVQSEDVKEKYIEILERFCQQINWNVSDFIQKIIDIGSPKFDAINSRNTELSDLPEEWKEIIGDGSRKIIFYNTHLSMLMPMYYERFLLKLKNVLAYFRERKDVILLWRPHPLTVQTIVSMNPVALTPYLDIVNQYKKEKWGIYDDTADMDRSIALSDAYYGSDSSVVAIYRLTGKPVLLHSPDVPTEVI